MILFGTVMVLIFNSLVSRSLILKLPSSNFIFVILEGSMITAHGLLAVLCTLLLDVLCLITLQPCCFILITFIRDLRIFIRYHTWSFIIKKDVWLLGRVQCYRSMKISLLLAQHRVLPVLNYIVFVLVQILVETCSLMAGNGDPCWKGNCKGPPSGTC
jgi:hypothetical protein